MAIDIHTISLLTPSTPLAHGERLGMIYMPQIAFPAGSGAGANSTVAVTGLQLPAKYMVVFGDLGQAGDAFVTSRSRTGFTVNVAPGLASATLAAGAVDLMILF